jgi:multicomponent Na+:H+ antiporter subunit D
MILFGFVVFPLLYIIVGFFPLSPAIKKGLAAFFAILNMVWAGTLLYQVQLNDMVKVEMGSWPAPYGIVLMADRFSSFLLFVASIIIVATVFYSLQAIDEERMNTGYFQFLYGVVMGVNGSFMAADLFNLYVWFEVMLMASFILMSHGGERKQLEGSIKYLMLNLISSFFFVAGIGLLYGKLGSLNLADIAQKMKAINDVSGILFSPLILIIVGFAIKGALFPFFFWLPASYHTPPSVVSALFAGLLSKVGIYSIIRFYTLILFSAQGVWDTVILWLGISSMVIGAVTATSQYHFRKILSFHIISQIGYVIVGLAFFSVNSIAAAIFFLGHNMLAKTNTYLVAGWIEAQSGLADIKKVGGFFKQNKLWSTLFFISAFSLAGIPPLSGFVGKFGIIKSGIETGYVWVALIALAIGLFTLFSMLKIWIEVFWKEPPVIEQPAISRQPGYGMVVGAFLLASATVLMGLAGMPIMDFCIQAAEDLMNPDKYIHFILNNS